MVKTYIKSPNEAPKGAKVTRGPQGGYYYEEGAKPMTTQPTHTSPKVPALATSEIHNKIASAAAGNYELSDAEYDKARSMYDALAKLPSPEKHPEYQKLWENLVRIFD